MVYDLTARVGAKGETLRDIHRKAIMDARARGLNYREMAGEFNKKGIPRREDARRPWTARMVAQTCRRLNLLQRDLEQERTEPSEPADLLKSA